MRVVAVFLIVWLGCFTAGCTTTDDGSSKHQPGKTIERTGAHTPAACFEAVKQGVIHRDPEAVFNNFTKIIQVQSGNLEGFSRELNDNYDTYLKLWQTATIIPGTMRYVGDLSAGCNVRMGDGDVVGFSFVNEPQGWKLGSVMVALQR